MTSRSNIIGIPMRAALEQRTLLFAANIRLFVRRLPSSISSGDDVAQLLRSSGCVGTNYIEANEATDQTDYGQRIRSCLKEAKESVYWLKLLDLGNRTVLKEMQATLVEEGAQLLNVFFGILKKVRQNEVTGEPEFKCWHCSQPIESLSGQCPYCGHINQCERCDGRIGENAGEKTEGYYNARFCRDCEETIINAA